MRSPFPGMDPYLEHPALWPDVHNRLVAAIADSLTPLVAPRYYIAGRRRAYRASIDELVLIGRPGFSVVENAALPTYVASRANVESGTIEVELPMSTGGDEAGDIYLEIHEVKSGRLGTLIELLSPANKLHAEGRRQYEQKRTDVLHSRTNLVGIDLLRSGEPMSLVGEQVVSDYRILVSCSWNRPHAQLHVFGVRQQPIPRFALPLTSNEAEPAVDLNTVLHEFYVRARFDLRLNYNEPAVPPLHEVDAEWALSLLCTDV